MPTTGSGALNDTQYPAVQTNQIDVDDEIAMLEGSVGLFAPQYTRSMKKAAKAVKVEWIEDEAQPVYTTLSGSITNVATTLTFAAGAGQHFKVNDIIHMETSGENIRIDTITGDVVNTMTRGWGTTAGTAATSGDGIVRIANNSPQGASYPTPKSTFAVGQFNLQQITRTSFAFVKSATMEQFRGEVDPVAYQKAKHLKEHLREIEMTIWLGQRFAGTGTTLNQGTQPQNSAAGLDSFIQTNKTVTVGALTQTVWETWLQSQVFRYGEVLGSKLIVCSPVVLKAISAFAANKLAPPSPEISKWGVRLRTYASVLGDVNLAIHPDWRQFGTGVNGGNVLNASLGGAAYSLDMDHFYLKGFRTTQYLEQRQNPGDDAFVAEYLTEFCPVVKQERLFAKLTGVTG